MSVIVATSGERSHPGSTTHTPAQLSAQRRAEVFAALGEVAPTAAVLLPGLPDGELDRHQDTLAALIAGCLRGSTLVVAPWRGDGHPDHAAAGAAAVTAVLDHTAALENTAAPDHTAAPDDAHVVLEYPIWAWHWGRESDLPPTLLRLELTPADLAAKQRAVHCHASQYLPLSDLPGDEPILSADFAAHFDRGFETFVGVLAERADHRQRHSGDQQNDQPASLDQAFFDDFYGDHIDPWGFTSRWYERRKRALTVAALPRPRFGRAFEPGCSIGVLTAELAGICDSVLAADISEQPLRVARKRLGHDERVEFRRLSVPAQWPTGRFDLIVLSEVGYYCSPADLRVLIDLAAAALEPTGVLVACHWRHPVADYPLSGDDVHRALRATRALAVLAEHREEDFLLDVFTLPPAVSVARATGLLR